MEFNYKLPHWENAGVEPSPEWRRKGYEAGESPAANTFNWFLSTFTGAVDELQRAFNPDAVGAKSLSGGTRIANGSNLNTYTTVGNYHCISDADAKSFTNCPIQSAFNMCVGHPTGQTAYLYQEIIEYVSGTRYYRECSASSLQWTTWVKTYDSNNLTPTAIGAANTAFSNLPDIPAALYNLHVTSNFKGTVDGKEYTFNTALTQAEYSVAGSNIEGAPTTGTIYGKLVVIVNSGTTHNNSSNWIWQLFYATTNHRIYVRNKVNDGAWSVWSALYNTNFKPTASEVGAIPKVAQSPTTGENDLDNVRMVGFYRITDTNINTPVKAVVGHTLMVIPWDNSTVAQVYWTSDVTASGMYFRTRHASGVWTAWQRIYTTGYNPTAEDVGAAKTDLSNVDNTTFANKASAAGVGGTPIVEAKRDTSTGNEVYKATVAGLGTDTRPIDGYSVTIIPDSTSMNAAARFQLNNQPSYLIRFRGTGKSNEVVTPTEPWINMGVAITLTYSSYCGAWLTDIQKITPAGIGMNTENWTFTLEDGSTVTKAVYVG